MSVEQVVSNNTEVFEKETEILRFGSSVKSQIRACSLDHMDKLRVIILSENMTGKLPYGAIPDRDIILVLPKRYDHEIGDEIPRKVAVVFNTPSPRDNEKINRDLYFEMTKITNTNRKLNGCGFESYGCGLDGYYINCVITFRLSSGVKTSCYSSGSKSFDKYFGGLNCSNPSKRIEKDLIERKAEDERRKGYINSSKHNSWKRCGRW